MSSSTAAGTQKKVVVHAGFPKTGSSALQLFFSANVAALDKAGVSYPDPERISLLRGGGGTGNLIQILQRKGFTRRYAKAHAEEISRRPNGHVGTGRIVSREYWETVETIVRNCRQDTVLLSGEFVGNQSGEQIGFMRDTLLARHDVHFIGFVRDPFDFTYSAWKQQVKTNAQRRSFDEHMEVVARGEKPVGMFRCFANLRGIGAPLTILNYDTYRSRLLETFLEHAGIASEAESSKLARDNRSLTDSEASILHLVNVDAPWTPLPRALSEAMRSRGNPPSAGRYYSARHHQTILDRFADDIAAINELIVGDRLRTVVRQEPDSGVETQSADIDLLILTARRALTERRLVPHPVELARRFRRWLHL